MANARSVPKNKKEAGKVRQKSFWGKLQESLQSDYYDYNLVLVVVLLLCFGLITLYSASSYIALKEENNDMFYFRKQAVISVISLGGAILFSLFDYRKLKKWGWILYAASLIMMVLVRFTPLGVEANGAKRWLKLGPLPQLQPAEIAKIAVIICVAYMIVEMGKDMYDLKNCAILASIGLVQGFAAYKLTSNLSTAVIIVSITAGLMFIAHPNWKVFVFLAVAVFLAAVIGLFLFYIAVPELPKDADVDYHISRIYHWLHRATDTSDSRYQTLQALYAIGSGGFFGRGFGNGTQKLGNIPEAQNDMIFAVVCEEWGVFGALIVMLLFGFLLYRLLFIARNAPDLFGSLIVSGIFIHIALQVLLNIAVVCDVVPNTGVTLPFISYGGSSILFLMVEIGIALSVSRRIRFRGTVNE